MTSMRAMSTISPVALLELEVLDPRRAAFRPVQRIRTLGDDAQPEVLQHRQHVRDRHRVAELHDLQVHALLLLPRRPVQVQSQGARIDAQQLQVRQVLQHILGGHVLLVGEREGVLVAVDQGQAGGLAAPLAQLRAQPVDPGEGRFANAQLDLCEVGLDVLRRVGAHQHVHACVVGSGDQRLALDLGAAEAIAHDLLDALAHLGVVAVARHVDQAGVEAVVRVAAHQQPHGAPLVQVDDAAHDADQLRHARLEEFVARIGLQRVEGGLAVVAGRIQAEMFDDVVDLAAQDRNVARAAVVGGGGPQSEEAVFAADAAAPVEGLHAHVVQVFAAVHGRRGVRLGDDQQLRLARLVAHVAAQHGGAGPLPLAARRAEDSEAGGAVRDEAVLAAPALQPVVPVSQQDEVSALHPVEQVTRLGHLARWQRRWIGCQLGDDLADALAHRHPVADDHAHVSRAWSPGPAAARAVAPDR